MMYFYYVMSPLPPLGPNVSREREKKGEKYIEDITEATNNIII